MFKRIKKAGIKLLPEESMRFLNLHSAVKMVSLNLAGIFSLIYLYKNGLQIWQVCLALAAILILRLIVRPLSLKLVFRSGLRKSVLLGSLSYAGLFQLLYLVNGINIWLFVYIIYAAVNDTLYWLPFHAYYASLGANKTRGKQIGMRESLVSFGSILSPAAGAFLIVNYGFYALFAAASFLVLLSCIPFLGIADAKPGTAMNFKQALKKIPKSGFWLFVGDGAYSTGLVIIWPLIIFFLFNNYFTYGWIFTIALVSQTMGYLVLGAFMDKGHGRIICTIALSCAAVAMAGKILFAYNLKTVILFAVIDALVGTLYFTSLGTVLYNSSRSSKNTLWFQFFAESGWDVGGFIIACIAAFFSYYGFGLRYSLIFSIIGLVVVGKVSRKYYQIG